MKLVAITLIALGTAASLVARVPANRPTGAALPRLMADCPLQCLHGYCVVNGNGGHVAPPGGEFYDGLEHSNCFAGNSCEGHTCGATFFPGTQVSPAAFGTLRDRLVAVAEGEIEAAVGLLRDYPGQVEYSQDRGAIQVRSCNTDFMVAHLPLTLKQLTALGE